MVLGDGQYSNYPARTKRVTRGHRRVNFPKSQPRKEGAAHLRQQIA